MLSSITSDDITHPMTAKITSWTRTKGFIEYEISVERKLGSNKKWNVTRRYSEFRKLGKQLSKFGVQLNFPPKKYFGNTGDIFVTRRKEGLQKFLDLLLVHPLLYGCADAASFLGAVSFSPIDIQEWVLLALRDKPAWRPFKRWTNCGWRSSKVFYEVEYKNNSYLLNGLRYGPDCCGSIDGLNMALNLLRSLQHPYVNETITSWADGEGIISINPIFYPGSLRDHLYKSNCQDDFFSKYSIDKPMRAMSELSIRSVCRQVLEALSFFHALSIPYADIHAGNIVITEVGCEIVGVEQVFAGQPSLHRSSMLNCDFVKSVEDMMVFAFGEFLYELVCGVFFFPINSIEQGLSVVPPIFRPVLQSIFSPEAGRMPDLTTLISNSLFIDVQVAKMNHREVVVPERFVNLCQELSQQITSRLNEDRVKLKHAAKMEKLHQLATSESERIRRRKIILSVSFLFQI
ncbi:hypothetical protein AB6A40_001722 [Gnathostoma spinigerum]|uniref:PX domain-containing protein n=1 Tax=Gnathostoma spinigerum TaxID=75299 RepID=A0ABD6EDT6_9BILA